MFLDNQGEIRNLRITICCCQIYLKSGSGSLGTGRTRMCFGWCERLLVCVFKVLVGGTLNTVLFCSGKLYLFQSPELLKPWCFSHLLHAPYHHFWTLLGAIFWVWSYGHARTLPLPSWEIVCYNYSQDPGSMILRQVGRQQGREPAELRGGLNTQYSSLLPECNQSPSETNQPEVLQQL